MSNLIVQNFRHGNKRTSLKLEHELWLSLDQICKSMNVKRADLLSELSSYHSKFASKMPRTTFTSFVRVFIIRSMSLRSTEPTNGLDAKSESDLPSIIERVVAA